MPTRFSTLARDLAGSLEEVAAGAHLEKAAPILEHLEAIVQEILKQINEITVEGLRSQEEAMSHGGATDS